jgi:hypothetical protein
MSRNLNNMRTVKALTFGRVPGAPKFGFGWWSFEANELLTPGPRSCVADNPNPVLNLTSRSEHPMAEIKAGSPFGMDGAMINKVDWNLALKRVNHDLRTDFIYAPHLGFIYNRAGDELIAHVKSDLKNGQYSPGLPLPSKYPSPSEFGS